MKTNTEEVIVCEINVPKTLVFSFFFTDLYSHVFSIGIRLLHLINFRMYTLMEKYISIYAKFMEAVRRLYDCKSVMKWQEEVIKLLENLISIDVEDGDTNVAFETFNNSVSLWSK